MHDSITSAPEFVKSCLDKRIFSELAAVAKVFVERDIRRVIITGCGTSLYSAYSNRITWHEFGTGIEIFQDNGFDLLEYPYLNLTSQDAIMGVSHSGGTKAVEDYLIKMRAQGITTVALTDVRDSRVFNAAEFAIVGPGGEDFAIPKTRSYLTQQFIVYMLGACVAEQKGKDVDWEQIRSVPKLLQQALEETEEPIKKIAGELKDVRQVFVVGSGVNYANANEAALKLIEAPLICSVGLQVDEVAHGYALNCDEKCATIILIPEGCKVAQRARHIAQGMAHVGSPCVVLCNDKKVIAGIAGIKVVEFGAKTEESLSFFAFIVPLYLFVYYLTLEKGGHPDLSSTINKKMDEATALFFPPGYH